MKQVIKIDGDLCANCASKIQAAVEKLPGVESASVNAMTYKFTLVADDAHFDDVLSQAVKIFDDIEPDCSLVLP